MGNHQCLDGSRVRVAYVHHEALTFSDYTDLGTGKTLHAVPGGAYDIAPASGRVVPEVPEPWFVQVAEPWTPAALWPAEPDAVPETEPEPEAGTDEQVPAEA